jgi:cytochrome c553
MRVLRLLLLSVPVLLATAAVAVERGNAEAGRALVSRSCITCHATSGTATQSDGAPPFSFLARDNKYRTAFVRG